MVHGHASPGLARVRMLKLCTRRTSSLSIVPSRYLEYSSTVVSYSSLVLFTIPQCTGCMIYYVPKVLGVSEIYVGVPVQDAIRRMLVKNVRPARAHWSA